MKIVAATGNLNKLREIREILSDLEIISEFDAGFTGEIEETGATFEENALLKARTVCKATGLPALADDSGICVEALGGAPGVHSARYAAYYAPAGWSRGNRAFLLEKLKNEENRRAYFCCVVALVYPDGRELTVEGRSYGEILHENRGTGGFGYDPIFLSDELGVSFAEASEEQKNAVSHRGKALRELKQLL